MFVTAKLFNYPPQCVATAMCWFMERDVKSLSIAARVLYSGNFELARKVA
jgi:hypothetical protein